jgi:hypothetical protein
MLFLLYAYSRRKGRGFEHAGHGRMSDLTPRRAAISAAGKSSQASLILPLAPARLSITTGWPHDSVSFCPMSRANMLSVPPPGANGTTMRGGRQGGGERFPEHDGYPIAL